MNFTLGPFKHIFRRYPETTNRSLRAWSAADEYLINTLLESKAEHGEMAICHDRFGVLAAVFHSHKPISILSYKSQEKALRQNLQNNQLPVVEENWLNPMQPLPQQLDTALLKVPKSLELFQFYLHHLHAHLKPDGKILAAFMTRHFSKQLLEIAGTYFESVEQGLAWKKSRVLTLQGPKEAPDYSPLQSVKFEENSSLQQYPGVFSANQIDPGSRLLLDHLKLDPAERIGLDIGAGNGILAKSVLDHHPEVEMHLTDDNFLAVESARLNISSPNAYFHYDDTLTVFDSKFFDFAVCNPPFHFEHEQNIEVSLGLFKDVARCLKPGGRFVLVANQHLNYQTHLQKHFSWIRRLSQESKYEVIECVK